MDLSKPCAKCLIDKPLDDFYKRSGRPGYRKSCKKCLDKGSYEYSLKNKDRIGKIKKKYKNNNKEKLWEAQLRYEFNIGIVDYMLMLNSQSGLCAICKKEEVIKNKNTGISEKLCVDHCHKTGKVRGLLCRKCNSAIGKLNDDIQLLKSAIKYLSDNT